MVNYQQGKIYKIVCNTTGNVYIGSTTQKYLSSRLSEHVNCYKNFLNKKYNFVTSFEIIKNSNYEIILIENCPCNSKDQLHAKERYWIELTECVNKYIPLRKQEEYYQSNKDKILEYNKKYYINNLDNIKNKTKIYTEKNKLKITERAKRYREQNKPLIKERNKIYSQNNKLKKAEANKKYRKENKNKIAEYYKLYNQINKEKIQEKSKEKFLCECGSLIRKYEKNRHFKSLKHKTYENSLL